MRWKSEDILSILDQCSADFTFPMLDNGYVYLAATRLSLHRSDADWGLVNCWRVANYRRRRGVVRPNPMDSCIPNTELQRDRVVIVLIERIHVHRLRQPNIVEITSVGREGRNIAALSVCGCATESEEFSSHNGLRAKSSRTSDEDAVDKDCKRQKKHSHCPFLGYPRLPT
jgi:hypothetical protein